MPKRLTELLREAIAKGETETARRLKVLAAQHDTTLQALGIEAWHLLLERYTTRRTER